MSTPWTENEISMLSAGLTAGLPDKQIATLFPSRTSKAVIQRLSEIRKATGRRRRQDGTHQRRTDNSGPTVLAPDDPGEHGVDWHVLTRQSALDADEKFKRLMHRAIADGSENPVIGIDRRPSTRHARPLAGVAPSSGCGSAAAACVEVA